MSFTIRGVEYQIDQHGVLNQLNPQPYIYDSKYVSTYDTPDYVKGDAILQSLRIGFIIGAHGSTPVSISDIGYGSGAFLKACANAIPIRYGKDVTDVVVEGVEIVDYYPSSDVITFHDCLEHIQDLSFISDLKCKTLVVSLPWCHFYAKGPAWMENEYIHLKPNEHLHHFDKDSLTKMMDFYGWQAVSYSCHEDIVRKSKHGLPNILTMAFKRK